MAWDSTKVDDSPSDSTNGRLNAVDWNSIVSYVKGIYSDIATHIATYHIANDDARLSNARTPTTHAHAESDVTGLSTSLSGKSDTSHNHTGTYEPANNNIQSHISSTHLALGETETTAYQGYKGQIAYHHALEAHAPADANNYVHPAAHAPSIITQDTSNRFVSDTEKSTWNGKQAPATTLAGYGITDAEAKNANIQSHISSAHAAVDAISATQKGAASGVVPLNSISKIDSTYLPAYVDDVIEAATSAGFPETGTTGIIYVALDTNKTFRWSGSAYVEISASLVLGETSATAYAGDKGKTAYDHSQADHAPANAEANVNADWNSATGDTQILNKPTLVTDHGVLTGLSDNDHPQYMMADMIDTDDSLGYSDSKIPTQKSVRIHFEDNIFGSGRVKGWNNSVTGNLGDPTVEEMALVPCEMTNKLRFIPASLQEESADGVTWTTSSRLTANDLADLMIGEGNGNGDKTIIPITAAEQSGYYRLTWDAPTDFYVFLDKLYLYTTTSDNTVNYKIEKYTHEGEGAASWWEVCNGNDANWPGHVWIPHNSIAFRSDYMDHDYHAGKVRITFSVTSSTNAEDVYLQQIAWFGGYPIGPSSFFSIDRYKDVEFPGAIESEYYYGDLYLRNHSTANAPSFYPGAIYFDTTLNKLRIGGATGWETVDST